MKGKIKYVPKSSKPKNVSRTKRTRKGTRHEKAGRRDNENRPPKTSHVLDESLSSQTKPQFKKFKKKSKMKRKNKDLSVPVVGGKVKDLTLIEDRGSSSNWEAFLKEACEEKSKSQSNKKERFSRKRKIGSEHGPRKRKFEDKDRETGAKKLKKDHAKELGNGSIKKDDIWFDDVDLEDIENATGKKVEVAPAMDKSTPLPQVSDIDKKIKEVRITKRLGIDCEMVGAGIDGKDGMLARVSIVNSFGEAVYDKFVSPMQKVVDYRTEVSGIRPEDLVKAPSFQEVQSEVAEITKEKLLIGHAIHNDLKVLLLSHPRKNIRDTSTYKPFKKLLKTRFPSLKKLAKEVLNVDIQSGEHSSVEDARCAMKIYQLHKKQWERSLKDKGYKTIIDRAPTIFIGNNNKDIKKRYRDRRDAREKRREKRKEKTS